MQEKINRGEIWLCIFDPLKRDETIKTRPALVISNDLNNQYSKFVTVLPITENVAKIFPMDVFLPSKTSSMSCDTKILCSQVTTIAKSRLTNKITQLSPEILKEIETKLMMFLSITA